MYDVGYIRTVLYVTVSLLLQQLQLPLNYGTIDPKTLHYLNFWFKNFLYSPRGLVHTV